MARILTDGAESADLSRWNGNASASASHPRSGSYSYIVSNASFFMSKAITPVSEFYLRMAVYFAATDVFDFFNWRNGVGIGGSLRTKTFGNGVSQVELYDGATLRATSSPFTMHINEWHVFELHVIQASGGTFQLKFDGTQVINFTGATNAQPQTDTLYFGTLQSLAFSAFWVDDLAVNDNTGGVDNSWCGDGQVLAALTPNNSGTYSDLIAVSGTPYQNVNSLPFDPSKYVYESTIGKKSTFNLSDVGSLPAGAAIARVWPEVVALETAAAGDKIATFVRSGTTDVQGADQALTLSFVRYVGAELLNDPATSAAWTLTGVNGLEAGAVVR